MLIAIGLIVLGLGLACVAYGILIERHWFRVVRYRLDILPAGAPSAILILHLSDLHFVRSDLRGKKGRFLASLPAADVTVITGDILGEPGAVEASVAALEPARGRLASYFVLGSHDHYAPRPLNPFRYFRRRRKHRRAVRGGGAELVGRLESGGWERIDNSRKEVELNRLPVELLGLDDAHIYHHDLRVAPRTSPERFGMAVMHSPDPAPELAALGYDLLVAGHTHGGQVRFPLVGALVTNSHLPRRLATGLARIGPAMLHTSPGIGTSKFAPFRFLCRPEAALLELHPGAGGGP